MSRVRRVLCGCCADACSAAGAGGSGGVKVGKSFTLFTPPGHRGVRWHSFAALLMRFDAGSRSLWNPYEQCKASLREGSADACSTPGAGGSGGIKF